METVKHASLHFCERVLFCGTNNKLIDSWEQIKNTILVSAFESAQADPTNPTIDSWLADLDLEMYRIFRNDLESLCFK